MSTTAATLSSTCPECEASIALTRSPIAGEVVRCGDCSAELEVTGVAPLRPSRYDVESFAALPNARARSFEVEIDWILRNSFPTLRAAELSRRLRDAGYPLGAGHIVHDPELLATPRR